jgi:diketogulonate reductase-like aldo/keto reductase
MKFHDITKYIEQAIDIGFSHIDTAAYYQTEQYVGQAIKESGLAREEFFITTKALSGLSVQKSLRKSLSNLGLSYVDLYLIHNPRSIHNIPETWKEFEKAQKDGLAKSIGISNFNDAQSLENLIKVANVKPAVNQIMLHPYNHHEMKPVLDVCARHNIVVEAYSSLASITTYPGGPVDTPVNAAAQRIGATATQVVFLWVKAKGAVIVTTSTTKAHMEEYLAVADLPALTAEEVAAIDAAGAQGPPSGLVTRLRTVNTKEKVLGALVGAIFLIYGLGRMCH